MKDTKTSVQSQFGSTAENYRHSLVHATGADLQWLSQEAEKGDYKTVLDAGCGAGHTSMAVAPYVESVISLDLTETMLKQVQLVAEEKALQNVETRLGDVENLPFEDASFDWVLTRYSAHHWPNPQKALSEIYRVLKPAGRFTLIDVIGFEDFHEDTYLQSIELLRDLSHVRDHSRSQWNRYFEQAGFSPASVEQWDLLLNFDAWVKRMNVPENRIKMIRELFETGPDNIREALKYRETEFCFQVASFDSYKPS